MTDFLNKTCAAISEKLSSLYEFISKDKPRKVLFFFAVAALFAAVYLLNILYPYWKDDFLYSRSWITWERLKSFQDIIDTQYKHYFEWGGRIVAHTILQTLLWWGKTYSDLLNAIMYVIYIIAIYRIVNLKAKQTYNLNLFIVINLLVWFLQFSWGDSCLWLTGSVNYLWMNAFMLLFLYPYCKLYIDERNNKFWAYAVLLFLAGIVVGWSHENTSVGAIAFTIILLVILYRKDIKIPLWAKTGLVGLIIGAAFLFLSPGTHVRIAEVMTTQGLSQSFIPRMLYGVYRVLYYTFLDGLPIFIVAIMSVFVYKQFGKSNTKPYAGLAYLLFASTVVILCSMIASSIFHPRLWFTSTSLAITGILLLFFSLDYKQQFWNSFARIAITLFSLLLFSQYFFTLKDCYRIRQVSISREQAVSEQKAQGKENIVITEIPLFSITNIPMPQGLSNDTLEYENEAFCLEHEIRSVRVEYKKN
jgi:hypothetical protein